MKTAPYILAVSLSVAYLANAAEFAPLAPITDPPPVPYAPGNNPPMLGESPYRLDPDGDGLPTPWDDYAFDGSIKRKEAIGLRHYGLIRLTGYGYANMIGQFDAAPYTVAVDDEHRVSWWTREVLPSPR